MLPIGAYAMNPDRGLRRTSVCSVFSGDSMMRFPIGSVSLPSRRRNMLPWMRVFGTVLVSTTLIHVDHGIEPKYAADCLISSSVIALAMAIILLVLAFRGSALFLRSFLKSIIVWMKYASDNPATPAFSGRPLPFGMWQRLHAVTFPSMRPLATTLGIVG